MQEVSEVSSNFPKTEWENFFEKIKNIFEDAPKRFDEHFGDPNWADVISTFF